MGLLKVFIDEHLDDIKIFIHEIKGDPYCFMVSPADSSLWFPNRLKLVDEHNGHKLYVREDFKSNGFPCCYYQSDKGNLYFITTYDNRINSY